MHFVGVGILSTAGSLALILSFGQMTPFWGICLVMLYGGLVAASMMALVKHWEIMLWERRQVPDLTRSEQLGAVIGDLLLIGAWFLVGAVDFPDIRWVFGAIVGMFAGLVVGLADAIPRLWFLIWGPKADLAHRTIVQDAKIAEYVTIAENSKIAKSSENPFRTAGTDIVTLIGFMLGSVWLAFAAALMTSLVVGSPLYSDLWGFMETSAPAVDRVQDGSPEPQPLTLEDSTGVLCLEASRDCRSARLISLDAPHKGQIEIQYGGFGKGSPTCHVDPSFPKDSEEDRFETELAHQSKVKKPQLRFLLAAGQDDNMSLLLWPDGLERCGYDLTIRWLPQGQVP